MVAKEYRKCMVKMRSVWTTRIFVIDRLQLSANINTSSVLTEILEEDIYIYIT